MKVIGENKETGDTIRPEDSAEASTEVKEESVTLDNIFDNLEVDTDATKTASSGPAEAHSQLPGGYKDIADKTNINHEKYDPEDLKISSDEKSAFIDALVTGDRYRQTYSIFGGRVNIVIRSRTSKETQAMYAFIRHSLVKSGGAMSTLEGDMSYLLLIAQIEEINGTKFHEMLEPFTYTVEDGKEVPPGWITDLEMWKSKPEGLTSALINRVQLFEYKYWVMVQEASNKNFWKTDTSIEE